MNNFDYHNVITQDRFVGFIDALLTSTDQTFAVDIETSGLNAWAPDQSVVSISITHVHTEETWVVPLDHPEGPWGHEWQFRLGEVCAALKGLMLVAHNAGFDLGWMRRFVPDVPLFMWWDTQTIAHLQDENRSKRLKSLAAPLVGDDWGIDVRDAKSVPWFTLAQYNALDTIATARLYRQQRETLGGDLQKLALGTVLPAQRALIDATHVGLMLDKPAAMEAMMAAVEGKAQAEATLMKWAEGYGMDPDERNEKGRKVWNVSWEPTAKWFRLFAEKAVEAEDLTVQEMTPGGRPSWRGGVLERLSNEGHTLADLLLEYRDHAKKNQFLTSWLEHADENGRVHGNFNIARASTGRLTSSDPNLQQVARDLKHLWRAPEGRLFAEVDFSQVELRVAAELIHRTVHPWNPMLEAFQNGDDLHSLAATLVTGGRVEDVTKGDRQKGKAVNFGFIFGMGARKFVQYAAETYGVDFTLAEAQRVRQGFFSLWEGLHDWHEYQRYTAHEQGYVETLYGRRRRLPALYSTDDYDRSEAERQAINSPVQGTASDMMLDALKTISLSIHPDDGRVVGTVHDSGLFEVSNPNIVEDICAIMVGPSVRMTVPIEVEAEIGTHWSKPTTTIVRSNK